MRLIFLSPLQPQPLLSSICWERKKTEMNWNALCKSQQLFPRESNGTWGLGTWLAKKPPLKGEHRNSYSQKRSAVPDSNQLTPVSLAPCAWVFVLFHWACDLVASLGGERPPFGQWRREVSKRKGAPPACRGDEVIPGCCTTGHPRTTRIWVPVPSHCHFCDIFAWQTSNTDKKPVFLLSPTH